MPQFEVPLEGGGTITVNASDAGAALENAQQQSGTPPSGSGIHQVQGDQPSLDSQFNYGAGSADQNAYNGVTATNQGTQQMGAQYGAAIQQALDALASGNREAFQRAMYEFDVTFQLDKDKFAEDTRRFGLTFGLNEGTLTGMYQGQPTLAAQNQYFNQGLAGVTLAAGLQANPFRQQQVLGQLGGLYGGQGVAGFQAPNTVAGVGTMGQQGGGGWTQGAARTTPEGMMFAQDMVTLPNGRQVSRQQAYEQGWTPTGGGRGVTGAAARGGTGMGYLQQMIDDIKDPTANQTSMNQVLNATPTPNKLNSVDFMRAAPSTQGMVLQAMQEKYGIDPGDAVKQIKNTLPQFQAPSLGGIKR